jgi:predicted DNA-binding transcriptional regulator AlpA
MAEKFQFPSEGLVRLRAIIAPHGPIPVSKSSWWANVKSGRFPKPTYVLGPRTPCWRAQDIIALINRDYTGDVRAGGAR